MFYISFIWELQIYIRIRLNELLIKYVVLHVTAKRILYGTRGFSDAFPELTCQRYRSRKHMKHMLLQNNVVLTPLQRCPTYMALSHGLPSEQCVLLTRKCMMFSFDSSVFQWKYKERRAAGLHVLQEHRRGTSSKEIETCVGKNSYSFIFIRELFRDICTNMILMYTLANPCTLFCLSLQVAESARLSYVANNFGPGSLKCNNLCKYVIFFMQTTLIHNLQFACFLFNN